MKITLTYEDGVVEATGAGPADEVIDATTSLVYAAINLRAKSLKANYDAAKIDLLADLVEEEKFTKEVVGESFFKHDVEKSGSAKRLERFEKLLRECQKTSNLLRALEAIQQRYKDLED